MVDLLHILCGPFTGASIVLVQCECTIILVSQFTFLFSRSDPRLCSARRKFTSLCRWFGLRQWPQSLHKLSGNKKKRNQKRPEGLWRFLCWILMPRVFWYIKNLKCELLGPGIYLCTVLFAVGLTQVVKFTWNCSIFSLFFLCVIPFCILDLFRLLKRYKFKRIESWKDKCIDVSLNKVFPFLIRSIWQNHIGDCSRQSRHWKLCIWMDRALDLKSLEAFDSIRTNVFNTGKYFCLNWTN